MHVVVTMDDLGLHPATRRAAKHLAEQGRITSVSLLANGPDADHCLDLEGIAYGVQLNVLQGRPLTSQESVSTLLRHDGCFLGDYDVLFQRFLAGKVQLAQVEQEWAAQIEWVIDHGISPTHLTSHGSLHAWPGLMGMAGRLAERYGVRWIRKPRHCDDVLTGSSHNRSEFMNICTMLQRLPEPIRTTDLVWGRTQEAGDNQPLSFLKNMQEMTPDVVEIVGCPGMPESGDAPLEKCFQPGPTRAEWGSVLLLMESSQWEMVWEKLDLVPTNYGSLNME